MRYGGLILFLILFLTTCDDSPDIDDSSDSNVITLTYWCASNPREIKVAEEVVADWNNTHDDIKVHLQPIPSSQSSEEVLLAAIAGGTTPDICSNMWPGAMDEFTSAGGLVALDNFQDFREVMDQRVPEDLLQSFRSPDSHYYQIPWKTNPIMMVYNKHIFEEANIKAPIKTYSEFIAAGARVAATNEGRDGPERWMLYRNIKPVWWQRFFDYMTLYIAASGGKTLFDGQEIAFNNDASVKVFAFLQEMYAKGYCPVTEFQGDKFINEQLATQITGPWMLAYIETFKKPGFRYGIMPIPVPDDFQDSVLYTYGDHKNISIFSTTDHPEKAWEFAKTLISPRADLRLLEIASQVPIRKGLATDTLYANYFNEYPKMVDFALQAPYTRGVDGISDLKEILDAITQEYEACVIYQRTSPEEAIANAAKRAKVIMDWNRSR